MNDYSLIDRTFESLQKNEEKWEIRKQQKQMAYAVYKALLDDARLVVEAPTGVGKSLAYLLPAISISQIKGGKTIVSSATIPLQNQIFKKDLPLIKKHFPLVFSSAILKGRKNYLCLRRVEEVRKTGIKADLSLAGQLLEQLDRIINAPVNERDELDFQPDDILWNQICSDPEKCMAQRCGYFKDCFLFKARARAKESDIVVVNHDLLIADMMLKKDSEDLSALPSFEYLVLDEAHRFEKTALFHLSLKINKSRMRKIKYDIELFISATKGAKKDFLSIKKALEYSEKLSDSVIENLEKRLNVSKTCGNLLPKHIQEQELDELILSFSNLMQELKLMSIKNESEEREMQLNVQKIAELMNDCEQLRPVNWTEEYIYWFERDNNALNLIKSPIFVGELIDERIFSKVQAAICTSATLSYDNKMEYFVESCGFYGSESIILDSPFDYQKQGALIVLSNMPEPNHADFTVEGAKALQGIITACEGRTFVLFTSYKMLRDFHDELGSTLRVLGYELLCQGDYSRERILELYKSSRAPVLFGTTSFWEGIDIKGEILSCVVIMKLPFDPPDDPIVSARCERAKIMGKNPFMSISVPSATIRLKQGLGRLIRSNEDRGIAVIMDNRIEKKFYGKTIMKSINDYKRISVKDIPRFLRKDG